MSQINEKFICPHYAALNIICPTPSLCPKEMIEKFGKVYCVDWVETQRAEGRKHLEDNASNPTKNRA